MPGVVIQCENAYKAFGACEALRGLSFAVEEGEVFGLIGPNGSGKTTTIRTLLGIYHLDRGAVSVFGLDPLRQFDRIGPQIGVMLEQPGLPDELNGIEYLRLYADLIGVPTQDTAQRVAAALESVELTRRGRDRLRHLSKGMRQRMSLARSLLHNPRLMILDEPFDGIDAESRRHLTNILPALARDSGTTIFVTSHNLAEMEKIVTRVAIIDHGLVVRLDSVEALCRPRPGSEVLLITLKETQVAEEELKSLIPGARWDPRRRQIAIDLRDGQLAPDEILRVLLRHNVPVEAFAVERNTLEDAYFSITSKDGDQ